LSKALRDLADDLNRRGLTIRGRPITPTQLSDLQDRSVIKTSAWVHPGRPHGGSATRYGDEVIETVATVAKALDEKRDVTRAVLVAFAEGAKVVHTGVRMAYTANFNALRKSVNALAAGTKRIRLPSGILLRPLDPLSRCALVDLSNGVRPLPAALDSLIQMLGLPDDLRSDVPDPESHFPSFDEVMTCLSIDALQRKVLRAEPAELVWAAQTMLTLFRYSLSVYRITSSTGSARVPLAVSDDPEVRASAEHVLRTLVAAGRLLDFLIAWSGRRTELEMAAFCAPVVLVCFDLLPNRSEAQERLENSVSAMVEQLPRLQALESLILDVPVELRHHLSWDSQLHRADAPAAELDELRKSARAWTERNPEMAAHLLDHGPSAGSLGEAQTPAEGGR
jgi:hypothetical protein